MKITEIINGIKPSLSFEVFPPKTTDKYESISSAVKEIAALNPSYMSVTYGAGGGTSNYTSIIAKDVESYGITSLAHLSCISSTKEKVDLELSNLKHLGIENILALRGDKPNDLNYSTLEVVPNVRFLLLYIHPLSFYFFDVRIIYYLPFFNNKPMRIVFCSSTIY